MYKHETNNSDVRLRAFLGRRSERRCGIPPPRERLGHAASWKAGLNYNICTQLQLVCRITAKSITWLSATCVTWLTAMCITSLTATWRCRNVLQLSRTLVVLPPGRWIRGLLPATARSSVPAGVDTRQRGVQWMAGTGGATSRTLTRNQCRSDSGNSN